MIRKRICNSEMSVEKEDILAYHHQQSDLRCILQPVKFLVQNWLKKDKENRSLLKTLCSTRDFSNMSSFPSYLVKLLLNPRNSFTSLHSTITDKMIEEELIKRLLEIIAAQEE
jgi:hypothetical protein